MNSTSETVGAFEAKTKLAKLLDRVSRGATFTITKHDRPIARLVGFESDRGDQRAAAATAVRLLRTRYSLAGLNGRSLRDEGRA